MGSLGAASAPVSTSNPAGIGSTITYIGNHAYAHSGLIDSGTTEQQQLKFTTGNSYITATLMINGGIDESLPTNGCISLFFIKINNEKIGCVKTETNIEDMPTTVKYKVLIPAFSTFEVTADSDAINFKTSVTMVGRVYS